MNKNKIKEYAPKARRELIEAVAAKAQILGLSDKKIEPVEVKGDLAIIAGRPFPRQIAPLRRNLEQAVRREGFDQLVERIAFTWFNRFTALRYMELHGFLDHGYRVLSHPKGGNIPEILEHATDLDLTGLDKAKVAELRLAGSKDNELYRLLLVAQCNALNTALPFLFERTNDETELLLPDNLLHTDSPLRRLVSEIDEADWNDVEIVGWLYQFYISEKKDAVIGKVVKSQDIPAATQLFTPNWIVKYLTQNTLGRQWLATYPASAIKGKMEFYIEPAEQTGEVKSQLKAITPAELNPEEITFFDPACGSGHILVEAYDIFKQIYEERGYARRDIPRLILEKNLFGLDIDERAAQLAAFAMMMKARADDRSLFRAEPPIKLNVMAIKESNGLDAEQIAETLTREKIEIIDSNLKPEQQTLAGFETKPIQKSLVAASKSEIDKATLITFLEFFKDAKTYGSLLRIPERFTASLPSLQKLIDPTKGRDLAGHTAVEELRPFINQAAVLTRQFDNVVANPPYMGNKYLTPLLKTYLKQEYVGYEKDLFSSFIIRNLELTNKQGSLGFMSPFVWMFISSYEELRNRLIDNATIASLIQLEYSGFDGATVPICTFTLQKTHYPGFVGSYIRLSDFKGAENQAPKTLEAIKNKSCGWFFTTKPDDFKKIPGSPIAYWVSAHIREIFEKSIPFGQIASPKQGMATTDNQLFLRFWYEPSLKKIGFGLSNCEDALKSGKKWFPYNKGGSFRKWYGNNDYIVDWENDGEEIKASVKRKYPYLKGNTGLVLKNTNPYFFESITWTATSSTYFGVRHSDKGFMFDVKGSSCFPSPEDHYTVLGFLASKQVSFFMKILNPTIENQTGNVATLPYLPQQISNISARLSIIVKEAVRLARQDWDSFEISSQFQVFPWLSKTGGSSLKNSFFNWKEECRENIKLLRNIERENNQLLIEAYSLQREMTPEVPEDQITLSVNPKYRYGDGLEEEECQIRFRYDSTKELLSYAMGCMMGRYSLDKPGLVYADAENKDFDHSQYKTFPADDDGIVPVSDIDWFTDDATPRLVEFIKTVFGDETLDENLTWIAESFDPKKGETPVETIRRYFSTQFFKNHMQMYKKRPIYWLFSSGKQKAFECLVYLHRYNESTLSRMRAQYVTPLQGKLNARIEHLRREVDAASSASAKTKLRKEVEMLVKKQTELAKFDEELRHYADQRIKLDLDDGVRVNYGKFGSLLAETKAITGGSED